MQALLKMSLGMVLRSGKVVGGNTTRQFKPEPEPEPNQEPEPMCVVTDFELRVKRPHVPVSLITPQSCSSMKSCEILTNIYQPHFRKYLNRKFIVYGDLSFKSLMLFTARNDIYDLCYLASDICSTISVEFSKTMNVCEMTRKGVNKAELNASVILDILKILYYIFKYVKLNDTIHALRRNKGFCTMFLSKLDEKDDTSFVGKYAKSTRCYHEIKAYGNELREYFSEGALSNA